VSSRAKRTLGSMAVTMLMLLGTAHRRAERGLSVNPTDGYEASIRRPAVVGIIIGTDGKGNCRRSRHYQGPRSRCSELRHPLRFTKQKSC